MKKAVRVISFVLTALMILSLVPMVAFATDSEKLSIAPDTDTLINGGYIKGIDPKNNTLAAVKAFFTNDAGNISAFRGDAELADTDRIGTGTVIRLSAGSAVKDSITAILYGDVNGDGIINYEDYELIVAEATCFDDSIEDGSVYEMAADINNDTVIDAFDLSLVDLQETDSKDIDQRGELPKAILNEVNINTVGDNGTVVIGGESVRFDTAYELDATQNLDEIANKEYRDWNVDIVISFNKDVDGSKVYLAGQYGSFDWRGNKLSDSVISAGTKVSIINGWLGEHLTYADVIEYVQNLRGAMHVEDAEEMLKVTCELVMTDTNTGDEYVVYAYDHIFNLKLPEVEMSLLSKKSFGNKGSMEFEGQTVTADVVFQYAAKETPASITDKEYKDWDVDFLISFNRDVDGSKVFLFGRYGDFDWTGGRLSDGTVEAGRKIALMKDWRGETVPYSAAVDLEALDCAIDVVDPPAGLVVTIQLVMTNPTTGTRYVIDTFTHKKF